MEKDAIFAALSLSVTAAVLLLLTGGVDACDGAPSMSAADACQQATAGPLYQLCANTLGPSGDAQEVTGFVAAAARAASQLYVATKDAVGKVVADPAAAEDLKAACRTCLDRHDQAESLLAGVLDHLRGCALADLRTDCATAAAAIDECATAVLPVGGHTPLYSLILLGRDRSVLALRLAILLVPNKIN
ncbi:uncharacterized protein LOC102713110 [Oryza brachyantha]|uniref:uncharacterized protein LOC102713110 n=1 Tax=Oryza brachyantha TaxID=4533 RepID=UPI001AD9D4DF|nr:uncharacterized protein LOC102713110 [Oryza brachyantha]